MMSALWVARPGSRLRTRLCRRFQQPRERQHGRIQARSCGIRRLAVSDPAQPGGQSSQDTTLPRDFSSAPACASSLQRKCSAGRAHETTIRSISRSKAVASSRSRCRTAARRTRATANSRWTRRDRSSTRRASAGTVDHHSAGSDTITIGSDGTVSVMTKGNPAATQVGTIELISFVNPAGLQARGRTCISRPCRAARRRPEPRA